MSTKSRLTSGRVPVRDSANVESSRYQFLDLSSAEPNLGSSSNGYILTYNTSTAGQRQWISQTNTAGYLLAQNAFNEANNKVNRSGDTMTGDLHVSANVRANNVVVDEILYSGLATHLATPLPNLIAQFTSNSTTYVQVNAQNIDPHGSADFVVTTDVGTDTTFYIDMGIQGSQSEQGTLYPLDGYLLVQGNTSQLGGNLIIGTLSETGNQIETRFVSGGNEEANVIFRYNTETVKFEREIVSNTTARIYTHANLAFDKANSAFNKANTNTGGGGFPYIDLGYIYDTVSAGAIVDCGVLA
jgi:hypothetical protein